MTYSNNLQPKLQQRYASYRPLVILALRILLILLMFSGVALLLWPAVGAHFEENNNHHQKMIISNEEAQQISSGEYKIDTHTHIDEPVLYGKDRKNQPFTIKAKSATEEDQNHVLLKDVKGYIDLKQSGRWIKITASRADYFPKEKRLEVYGSVILDTSDGYHCQTSHATVTHTDYYKVIGSQPVTARNAQTRIEASGFTIDEQTQTLTFTGRVRSMHIQEP